MRVLPAILAQTWRVSHDIAVRLPAIGSQEGKGLDALAVVKFFTPDSSWTWYASEFDGEMFYGLVVGFEPELGSFSLTELQSVRGKLSLPVERDKWFTPTSLRSLMAFHDRARLAA